MKIPETYIRQIADVLYRRIEAQVAAMPGDTITEETVRGITEDGRFVVLGVPLAVIGSGIPLIGQRVHVLHKDGRPRGILLQKVRRAQPGFGEEAVPLVEELLLIEVSEDVWDVYFRNADQATRLRLHETINVDIVPGSPTGNVDGPYQVGWGERDNTFFVRSMHKLSATLWHERFFVFQLSRAEGVAAGSNPVSAALVSTITLPVFTLPTRFSSWAYFVDTEWHGPDEQPHQFPDMGGRNTLPAVLTRDLAVVVWYGVNVGVGVTAGSLAGNVDGPHARLIAVRSTAGAIIWESSVTAEWPPAPTPPGAPPLDLTDIAVNSLDLQGAIVLHWDEARPTDSRVLSSWIRRTTFYPAVLVPSTGTVTHLNSRGVIENGQAVVAWDLQPWSAIAFPPGVAYPVRRALSGSRRFAVLDVQDSASVMRIEIADLSPQRLISVATEAPEFLGYSRGPAFRFLSDRLYVIAEPSATLTTWPAAGARERFVAFASGGTVDLSVGLTYPEDGALRGRGAIADLPSDIAEPDGLYLARLAYHLVGAP